MLKGTSGRKNSLAQMKEHEKCKKRAITDLNAPKGSRDIPFQSHEFEQFKGPGGVLPPKKTSYRVNLNFCKRFRLFFVR